MTSTSKRLPQKKRTKEIAGTKFASRATRWKKALHVHPFAVVAGIETGGATIWTEESTWLLSSGSVAYIPPHIQHATEAMGDYSGWILELPSNQLKMLPKVCCVLEASTLLIVAAQRITEFNPSVERTKAETNVISVLIDELRRAREANFLRIPVPKDVRLKKIADAIVRSPCATDGIDQWAKASAMSRRSFTRHFTAETGLSFSAWRQRVKMYAAVQMLSKGDSVTRVAFELGYRNPSSFITIFRKHHHHSPAEYIRRNLHPQVPKGIESTSRLRSKLFGHLSDKG